MIAEIVSALQNIRKHVDAVVTIKLQIAEMVECVHAAFGEAVEGSSHSLSSEGLSCYATARSGLDDLARSLAAADKALRDYIAEVAPGGLSGAVFGLHVYRATFGEHVDGATFAERLIEGHENRGRRLDRFLRILVGRGDDMVDGVRGIGEFVEHGRLAGHKGASTVAPSTSTVTVFKPLTSFKSVTFTRPAPIASATISSDQAASIVSCAVLVIGLAKAWMRNRESREEKRFGDDE